VAAASMSRRRRAAATARVASMVVAAMLRPRGGAAGAASRERASCRRLLVRVAHGCPACGPEQRAGTPVVRGGRWDAKVVVGRGLGPASQRGPHGRRGRHSHHRRQGKGRRGAQQRRSSAAGRRRCCTAAVRLGGLLAGRCGDSVVGGDRRRPVERTGVACTCPRCAQVGLHLFRRLPCPPRLRRRPRPASSSVSSSFSAVRCRRRASKHSKHK